MKRAESQKACLKKEILDYVLHTYGTSPDYPWKTPDFVLRHNDNRKWYGVMLEVRKESMGLHGTGYIEILNVKCDPDMAGFLVSGKGILPGYHMNKKNWISILLDGTVEKEQILALLDQSYLLTASKKTKEKLHCERKRAWLIPANPGYFDLEAAFAESSTIDWHQRGNIHTGDLVYIYMAAPVSAVLYQCEVTGTGGFEDPGGNQDKSRTMELKLKHRFMPDEMNRERMKLYGVGPVRSARSIPPELERELEMLAETGKNRTAMENKRKEERRWQ